MRMIFQFSEGQKQKLGALAGLKPILLYLIVLRFKLKAIEKRVHLIEMNTHNSN